MGAIQRREKEERRGEKEGGEREGREKKEGKSKAYFWEMIVTFLDLLEPDS